METASDQSNAPDFVRFFTCREPIKRLSSVHRSRGRAMNVVDKLKPFSLSMLPVSLLLLIAAPNRPIAGQARIYWLDLKGSGSLHSAKPDGSDPKTVVTGNGIAGPDGVAVDATTGKIYWTNMSSGGKGSVQRCNLDGSKVEYVIPPGGTYLPKQIQVDLAHGR